MMLLAQLIDIAFKLAYFLLFARIIISWIPHDHYHPAIRFVYRATEPMLAPFRNLLPPSKIGIDISPIFAFIALEIIRALVFRLLF